MVEVFAEVRRVLRDDGVLWLNLGDSYNAATSAPRGPSPSVDVGRWQDAGLGNIRSNAPDLKPKDLVGIPWQLAFALRDDGWYLRSAMPWVKRSAMPESCTDRPASALEYVFLLTKNAKYYWDADAVRVANKAATLARDNYTRILENDGPQAVRHDHETQANPAGRNFRNTDLYFESIETPHGMVFCGDEPVGLDVNPAGFKEAHFATFPPKLVAPLIKAGTSVCGCCPDCGAPERRVTEASGGTIGCSWHNHSDDLAVGMSQYDPSTQKGGVGKARDTKGQSYNRRTLAWEQTCECGRYDVVPCIVLDPFAGAATTCLVAAQLHRDYIGIELNPDYCEMARKRLAAVETAVPAAEAKHGQMSLLEGM